jgi:hypothetical protein
VQRVAISLIILLFAYSAEAQEVFNLRGFVRSVDNKPLAQAHVFLQETRKTTVTRNDGSFEFSELKPGTYRLHVSYLGYKCIHQYSIDLRATHNPIDIIMVPEFHELQEVSVVGQQQHDHDDGTLEVVKANASFLEKNTCRRLLIIRQQKHIASPFVLLHLTLQTKLKQPISGRKTIFGVERKSV